GVWNLQGVQKRLKSMLPARFQTPFSTGLQGDGRFKADMRCSLSGLQIDLCRAGVQPAMFRPAGQTLP
ncbi:MAG TPA: hypothetical protein VGY66_10065, partial [Gemmataceae bacterium]|nr:hypothetical protein [Gemmataceae bacterium]